MTDTSTPSRLSSRIIEEVAADSEKDPLDLAPLYDVIDPDALDALFRNGHDFGTVSFVYEQHHVTANADGSVSVEPVSDDTAFSDR